MFKKIRKRDERIVGLISSKITPTLVRAGKAIGESEEREAKKMPLEMPFQEH